MSDKIVIGIDPDVDKCGVGIRTKDGLALFNWHLWEVFDIVNRTAKGRMGFVMPLPSSEKKEFDGKSIPTYHYDGLDRGTFSIAEPDVEVVIERYEGKNRSWHGGGKGSAFDVGRNAEIANQIVKYCEAHNIKHRTIQPKGYSKINAADFKRLTGYEGQTNKDTRVGGLIAYNAYLGTI